MYFFRVCPLQIWTLKTCNQAILKIDRARSFKLRQLMSRLPGKFFWKLFFSSSYCPLQIWPLKTCNPDISKLLWRGASNMLSRYRVVRSSILTILWLGAQCFISTISSCLEKPWKTWWNVAFHQRLYCLIKYLFRSFQSNRLNLSSLFFSLY